MEEQRQYLAVGNLHPAHGNETDMGFIIISMLMRVDDDQMAALVVVEEAGILADVKFVDGGD